jgi:site-specific DNA-cytosine methylase
MSVQDKTVAEFFAGIGLMRIGLENAGWRIALAKDTRKHLKGSESWKLD